MDVMNMMYTSQLPENARPISIRYPRGTGVMPEWKTPFEKIEIGQGRVIREGNDIAYLTIGHIGNYAVEATGRLEKEGVSVGHYDMRFVKPLDKKMLHDIFKKYKYVITVEDGSIQGGFGSAVLEFMADNDYQSKITRLGIPDAFIEHGTQLELQKECGFDPEGVYQAAKKILTLELV